MHTHAHSRTTWEILVLHMHACAHSTITYMWYLCVGTGLFFTHYTIVLKIYVLKSDCSIRVYLLVDCSIRVYLSSTHYIILVQIWIGECSIISMALQYTEF